MLVVLVNKAITSTRICHVLPFSKIFHRGRWYILFSFLGGDHHREQKMKNQHFRNTGYVTSLNMPELVSHCPRKWNESCAY